MVFLRCAVLFGAILVDAVRVDEDPDAEDNSTADGGLNSTETVSATTPSTNATTKDPEEGALEIIHGRKSDTEEAMKVAAAHVSSAEKLAQADKIRALDRSARHAIVLDRVAEEQEESSKNALSTKMRAERMNKRADATDVYKEKTQAARETAAEDVAEKKQMEDLRIEHAVRAGHEEGQAHEAWEKADLVAQDAIVAKEAAKHKLVMDKEVAKAAVEDSAIADSEAAKKAAAAKALQDRVADKKKKKDVALEAREEAEEDDKIKVTEEAKAVEACKEANVEMRQAQQDKAAADKAKDEAIEKDKVAKARCAFDSTAADEAVADAKAALEVHSEKVDKTNNAAAHVDDARVQAKIHEAVVKHAEWGVAATNAYEKASDASEISLQQQQQQQEQPQP